MHTNLSIHKTPYYWSIRNLLHFFLLNFIPQALKQTKFITLSNVRTQSFMPNLLSTLSIYVFYDKPKIPWERSRWIYMPNTKDALPRSFISKLFEKNILLSCNKPISLLASRISSTYNTKRIKLLPLNTLNNVSNSLF